jgi:hypothetical protein
MFNSSDLDNAMNNFEAEIEDTTGEQPSSASFSSFDSESASFTNLIEIDKSGTLLDKPLNIESLSSTLSAALADPKTKEMVDLGLKATTMLVDRIGVGKLLAGAGVLALVSGLTLDSVKPKAADRRLKHH